MQKIEYGRLFTEISNTYSEIIIDNQSYFFKHPSQSENFSIYDRYSMICEFAKSRGIQTEDEKLNVAIDGGWWTREQENKIHSLKHLIKSLKQTKDRLIYPSQKQDMEKQILRNERILLSHNKERRDAIGYTVEQYAGERFQDETIIRLTYKNRELTQRLFSDESEYYYLSDEIVDKIRRGFESHNNILIPRNIKCVAATGFFQNLMFVTECNPLYLWGKAAIECTKYQLDLVIYGKIFRNLIKYKAEAGEPISEEIIHDPEKFVDFSESDSPTITLNKDNNNSSPSEGTNKVTSFVGATSEDLKKMGVKVEKIGGKSLLEMVKERGGKMNKQDYLDARLKM